MAPKITHLLVAWGGQEHQKKFTARLRGVKKKNKIEKLQVSSGDVITDVQEMENLATDYFKNLYTVDPAVQPEFITGFLQQKIDDPMNEALCANFTD